MGENMVSLPVDIMDTLKSQRLGGEKPVSWSVVINGDSVTLHVSWNRPEKPTLCNKSDIRHVNNASFRPAWQRRSNKSPATKRRDSDRMDAFFAKRMRNSEFPQTLTTTCMPMNTSPSIHEVCRDAVADQRDMEIQEHGHEMSDYSVQRESTVPSNSCPKNSAVLCNSDRDVPTTDAKISVDSAQNDERDVLLEATPIVAPVVPQTCNVAHEPGLLMDPVPGTTDEVSREISVNIIDDDSGKWYIHYREELVPIVLKSTDTILKVRQHMGTPWLYFRNVYPGADEFGELSESDRLPNDTVLGDLTKENYLLLIGHLEDNYFQFS